jgi:hypothetical protein
MKAKSMIVVRMDRKGGNLLGVLTTLVAVVVLLLIPLAVYSAGPGSGSGSKSDAVKFEDIPGSTVKLVILSAKAAERLGIETGEVSKKTIIRNQMVGGRVIPPVRNQPKPTGSTAGFGSFGRLATAQAPKPVPESPKASLEKEAWILVTLSPGEWERLRKDMPARVLPLATRDGSGNGVIALPSGMPPHHDLKRTMLKLYYKVPGKDNGLTLYHRVRVELPVSGSDEKQMVVPYGSVYYDAQGTAWVYVNPKPLVFERQRIVVERVVGDLAVLSEGPPVGTTVVTVGAALLYGAEVVFGK